MSKILAGFYANEPEREEVKEFLIEVLKELAVERVFDKQSISGVYEARKVILKAFDRLEELYGKIKPPVNSNSR